MNDYESAENWYARIVQQEETSANNLLIYGQVLKVNGKYADAKRQLEAYTAKVGRSASVAAQIDGCESALAWMAATTLHRLPNEYAQNNDNSQLSVSPSVDAVYLSGEPKREP